MAGPYVGRGVELAVKAPGDSAFVTLTDVFSIKGPNISIGEAECSTLASTFKPYLPTIPEGEASLSARFDAASAGIQKMKTLTTVPIPICDWQITYIDGYVDTFKGFLKSLELDTIENESVINVNSSLRMTTDITRTAP